MKLPENTISITEDEQELLRWALNKAMREAIEDGQDDSVESMQQSYNSLKVKLAVCLVGTKMIFNTSGRAQYRH